MRPDPNSVKLCNSLHSSAQGDAATRGGRTNLDGVGASRLAPHRAASHAICQSNLRHHSSQAA
jgi:hypothetical protein